MTTFRRLLGFLGPYKRGVTSSFLLAAAAMGMGVLVPFLVGRTVDDIRGGGGDLTVLAWAIVAAGVLRLVFAVVRRLVAGRVSLGVEFDLRNRMYGHLQSLELGFFDSQQTGQLMSRSTVDLQSVRFFLGYGLIFMLQSALTILIAAGVMIAVNPILALVALAPMPWVIWVAFRYGRRNRPAVQEVQQRIAELTAEAEENVSGVRVVKAFAQERRQLRRFNGAVGRVFDQSMVSARLRAFYNPFIGFLPQLGLAAILLVGGRQAINGTITLGEFVAFYGYVLMLTGPMRMLGVSLGMAQRAVASGARVFEILDRAPALTARDGAPRAPARRRARGAARRELRLRRRGPGPARRGPGGGARHDRRAGGRHRLGQDHACIPDPAPLRRAGGSRAGGRGRRARRGPGRAAAGDRAGLRRRVPVLGVAAGEHRLRPSRRRRRGDPCARHAVAGVDSFAADLPEGYETMVGERGLTLSGGQRQRVAIARALLAEPRILILDDATSSVDATTESTIKEALREVMEGRTTFVIAHRLSTIALADVIAVLEDGRVVAHGSHEELLDESSLYREIAVRGLPDQVFLTRKPEEPEVAGL